MARPTVAPGWATGAARRIEPNAQGKSDGFVAGTRSPAKVANWAIGHHADWIAALAGENDDLLAITRPDLVVRSVYLPAAVAAVAASAGAPDWRLEAPAFAGFTGSGTRLLRVSDSALAVFSVRPGSPLPSDCTVTAVRAFVRGSTGTGLRVALFRTPVGAFDAPVQIGTTQTVTTTDITTVEFSGLSIRLSTDISSAFGNANLGLELAFRGGTGGGAVDAIYTAEVQHTVLVR